MIKLAALWFALLAIPAMASLTGMTPEICGAGEYLIGVSGRSSDWIDAIRPVCAGWNPATGTAGVPRNGPSHGGGGGGEGVAVCPRGSAVSGWEIRHVTRGDSVFLQYVAPQCRTILPPREIVQIGRLQFGRGNPPMSSSGPTFHGCGKQELAIGFSVAVGENYVSEVDLKCRFVPNASPPMTSRDTGHGTRLTPARRSGQRAATMSASIYAVNGRRIAARRLPRLFAELKITPRRWRSSQPPGSA